MGSHIALLHVTLFAPEARGRTPTTRNLPFSRFKKCQLTCCRQAKQHIQSPSAYLHNLQHLFAADVPISVQVIHAERPFQLLFQLASWRHAQGDDELPEVYRTVAIGVKGSEDVLSELGGVTVGEEISVDFLELLYIQGSTRTILQETLRKRNKRKVKFKPLLVMPSNAQPVGETV